jgi:hypothetical protein
MLVDILVVAFLILDVRINPRLERRYSGLEAIGSATSCQKTRV